MTTRVMHVVAELGYGGAETMVLDLARRGHSVGWTSAVASAGGARLSSLHDVGVEHFHVPVVGRAPLRVLTAAAHLRHAIRRFGPDVVVAHNISSSVVALAASTAAGSRLSLVSVFHGVTQKDCRLAAQVLDRFPGAVVAVSGSARDRLVAQGLRRSDLSVIHNAVSIPELPSRRLARMQLDIPDERPVALCLARLAPQKRLDVLLRAWALVPPGGLLLVAGDGPLRGELEALAGQLDTAATTRFLGAREDVAALLAAADLGVLSSDWEGLPFAALESMAAGLPMVATAVDGLTEVVAAGAGRLVPTGDPHALATALAELLFDGVRRRAAGDAARELVGTRHDPQTMLCAYAALVADELSRPRPRVALGPMARGKGR